MTDADEWLGLSASTPMPAEITVDGIMRAVAELRRHPIPPPVKLVVCDWIDHVMRIPPLGPSPYRLALGPEPMILASSVPGFGALCAYNLAAAYRPVGVP